MGVHPRAPTKEEKMLAEKSEKSANFLRIVCVLQSLLESGIITAKEYSKAKKYYQEMTGADIIVVD